MATPKRRPARPAAKKKAAVRTAARKKAAARAAAPAKAPAWRRPAAERRRADPQSLRLRAIEPSMTVNDLERSVRFYTEALGFFVAERWEDKGVLKGVMLKAGVCTLGLSQDDWSKGKDRQKGEGFRIWCQTAQDIDALAARLKSAGVKLTEEPTTQAWGARTLSVDDPDGFHLTIYRE
jgi:lactoylglutathione lyase